MTVTFDHASPPALLSRHLPTLDIELPRVNIAVNNILNAQPAPLGQNLNKHDIGSYPCTSDPSKATIKIVLSGSK